MCTIGWEMGNGKWASGVVVELRTLFSAYERGQLLLYTTAFTFLQIRSAIQVGTFSEAVCLVLSAHS
jgi:hypothetical protein